MDWRYFALPAFVAAPLLYQSWTRWSDEVKKSRSKPGPDICVGVLCDAKPCMLCDALRAQVQARERDPQEQPRVDNWPRAALKDEVVTLSREEFGASGLPPIVEPNYKVEIDTTNVSVSIPNLNLPGG